MMNKIGERIDKMSGYHYAYYDIGDMPWQDYFRLVQASPLQIDNALISGLTDLYCGTCSLQDIIDDFDKMEALYRRSDERWGISIFFKDADGHFANLFCFPAENNVAGVQAECHMPHLDELLGLTNTFK